VLGATGVQGGSVVRALSASGLYRVVGLTRDPDNAKCAPLKSLKNVTLVKADTNNAASLAESFRGAWGAFSVTQFSEGGDEEVEGNRIADAALSAGVRFFMFSSLINAEAVSGGRRHVAHFTKKNLCEQKIRKMAFPEGAAFFYPGMYSQNWVSFMAPRKGPDGVYNLGNVLRSDVQVPYFDAEEDTGKAALEMFKNPAKWAGKSLKTGVYSTVHDIAAAFTKATGQPARYVRLPDEMGKSWGAEIFDMFQLFNEFGYYGGEAPQDFSGLYTQSTPYDVFVRNKAKFT